MFKVLQVACQKGDSNRTIVPQGVAAIWDCLVKEFMAVPSTKDWRSIAEEFLHRWSFPLCCGAVDGKHIQMSAPRNSRS
ncbi:hypothetical protein CRENBAI_024838 [Crenichthys baileyi]|uniref:DDE Tnp4 domain-containing protein n=1 Tax=Crenichthys baileyi TaxID=28760 RepID=A0AAV9S3U7_9TELE